MNYRRHTFKEWILCKRFHILVKARTRIAYEFIVTALENVHFERRSVGGIVGIESGIELLIEFRQLFRLVVTALLRSVLSAPVPLRFVDGTDYYLDILVILADYVFVQIIRDYHKIIAERFVTLFFKIVLLLYCSVRLTAYRHCVVRRIGKKDYSLYVALGKREFEKFSYSLIARKIVIVCVLEYGVISLEVVRYEITLSSSQRVGISRYLCTASAYIVSECIELESAVAV